ncbi:MAG: xanthine dehydrogenase family protein molybdopterin-binding subunit [Dehalococcoidia bacterium]
MVDAPERRVIGTRPVRPDGVDKVTGRAIFGADVRQQGTLYGRVLRSPHAHAVIKSIDASKALALDGVYAVVTAADLPEAGDRVVPTIRGPMPLQWRLDHLIASSKALFRGHAIAALCATDPHLAEDAIDLIEVEYELLPPVMSGADAEAPDAPILLDDGRAESVPGLFEPIDGRPTNIARNIEMTRGDIDAGFEQADIVIEREFETAAAHQGYIEPHAATAFWNHDGRLTIWTSTQGAFGARQQLNEVLQVPLSDIKVIPTEIGGGFGGKNSIYLEPLAALLSKQAGRPVQMVMSRADVFEASGPASATRSRAKIGVTRDGTIVAADIHLAYESGAYPGAPVAGGARCALTPYDIPNLRVQGYDVVVNKPKVGAYRAPGASQGSFAVESLLDEIARELDMDPIELRMKNVALDGSTRPDGATHGVIGDQAVMEAVQASAHYRSELQGENRGRGVAMGFWQNGGGESSAYANINADGTVSLVLGSVDIGGQRAALAMQFAETMALPYEDVHPQVTDTDSIGFTGNTGGSRTTFATGWAVHEAALDLRKQLEARAAQIWEVDPTDVAYDDDGVLHGPDGTTFTFKEIASQLPSSGGMLQGRADVVATSVGGSVGAAFAAHIVDVEVDPDTGKVEILRYTAIQDVGTAIHPSYVEGQIQGGAAQGIGMALSEEYLYEPDGRQSNASFLDYRMPTTVDLPMIETILVEVPNPGHPYGVRGVGEVPMVPPLGAVSNAIYDAIGVRMRKLPATPTAILDELLPDNG